MEECSEVNSVTTGCEKVDNENNIKKELEIRIKPEPNECIVCSNRSIESYDIFLTSTAASGTSLHGFLCKLTNVDLANFNNCPKHVCKTCLELINVLEEAEIEYIKLKQTFEAIISKNPLFEIHTAQPINLASIKNEFQLQVTEDAVPDVDSEDEPLALARKRRQLCRSSKRKKKSTSATLTRKSLKGNNHDSWSCEACGVTGVGGVVAETAHKLSVHTLQDITFTRTHIKTEDSNDGSQSTQFTNGGVETADEEGALKEDMGLDDDDSSNYFPDESELEEPPRVRTKRGRPRSAARKRPTDRKRLAPKKVMHQCDRCPARYSSLDRLTLHREKHDSKPPYICEVCGAHYKHKRACDIHVALHKGISDWKCEECNKLFPSKGALHRHNNIHTGEPNYQCDLCGKSFIHTSSFKMHKLTHSGVKPHACDVCGLALMTRSHLKRHKRVHSGEKRHECPVCGKRFSERYNLAAHSKSHEAGGEAVPLAAPRRPMFRCAFCPDRFERRYMLERHCATTHGRALDRPPPTPRNTMSKLLKAQARRPPLPPPAAHAAILHTLLADRLAASEPNDTKLEVKEDASPERESPPAPPVRLTAPRRSANHASSAVTAAGSWAGAFSAEFALRPDYPQ